MIEKEKVMELIKRVFQTAISAVKGLVSLLLGKNEKLGKKLPIIAALLFVAVCTVQSLNALALAKREAAQRRK